MLYVYILRYLYVCMYCCVLEKVDIYCLLRIAFRTKQPSAGMLAARSINVILCHYASQSASHGCQVCLWQVRHVVVHCCCFCYCFLCTYNTCLFNFLSICVAFEMRTSRIARSQDSLYALFVLHSSSLIIIIIVIFLACFRLQQVQVHFHYASGIWNVLYNMLC